jgi:hypothetical protein
MTAEIRIRRCKSCFVVIFAYKGAHLIKATQFRASAVTNCNKPVAMALSNSVVCAS